ncbi:MAG: hypothetical protein AB1758_03350 [Candidatus Eremiobacterota bacterium]
MRVRPFASFCMLFVLLTSALLTAQTGSDLELVMAQWEPDGARVAMLVNGPDGREIWVLSRHGDLFKRPLKGTDTALVGWTPGGALVLDEGNGQVRLVVPEPGGAEAVIRLPEAAVPLAANDQEAFYLSVDCRYLLSIDREGQTRVIAELPVGMRPPASLSPDGRCLAMRRAQRTTSGWETEIWVVESGRGSEGGAPLPGRARQVARVPASYVSVSWHPSEPSLLLNYPVPGDRWDTVVVTLAARPQTTTRKGLNSPAQWDRSGRLYTADHTGVQSGGKTLQKWNGRLNLWAVSPDGDRVLASWQTSTTRAPAFLLELSGPPRQPVNVLSP